MPALRQGPVLACLHGLALQADPLSSGTAMYLPDNLRRLQEYLQVPGVKLCACLHAAQ